MGNPLYRQYGNVPLYENGIPQLLEEAHSLRQRVQNPRAEVERLLQSGQMSQAEFNRLNTMAQGILGMRK